MTNRLTDTLDFQAQALVLRSERQRLLASNIANADTPGYQARDMDFARSLKEATGTGEGLAAGVRPRNERKGTQGHIPLGGAGAAGGSTSTYTFAQASQNSADNNTVDMDRQRALFADNSVRYEAALRFINGSVRTMLDAIKGQSS